jgi:biotin operon repressor
MSNKEVVLSFIRKSDKDFYCDDCLSDILNITPRQQVNQKCNQLKDENVIIRVKEQCFHCSKDKLVNKLK